MAPVQIKVVYDYYSAKRTTLFFITEEELLNLDFHSFKSRLLLEVPHIAKSKSAKALRQNDNKFWPFSLFMSSRSRFNAEFKSTLRFFFLLFTFSIVHLVQPNIASQARRVFGYDFRSPRISSQFV